MQLGLLNSGEEREGERRGGKGRGGEERDYGDGISYREVQKAVNKLIFPLREEQPALIGTHHCTNEPPGKSEQPR